jgi:hypothetical protein
VQHHKKVTGSEVRCGGAPMWWKKWIDGKGPMRGRDGDLLEVGKMGRPNWGIVAPHADKAGPHSFKA